MGPFKYESDPESLKECQDLPTLGPYELEGHAIYIGQWKNGNKHGKGKQIWSDGSIYEGFSKNGMANGKGRLIHADGDVYEGDWKDDRAHGQGKYTHLDNASYNGGWFEDKQQGYGVESWPDGARYEGFYKDGKKHGKGKFYWSDGSYYDGDFENNNIHGRGTYIWADGRKYDGSWKGNKMDGEGKLRSKKVSSPGLMAGSTKATTLTTRSPVSAYSHGATAANTEVHGRKENNMDKVLPGLSLGFYISANGVEKKGEWHDGRRVCWVDNDGNHVNNDNASDGDDVN